MSPQELQARLGDKGVDVDVMGMMRELTEAEAAKHLAQELAKTDAELRMRAKLAARKRQRWSKAEAERNAAEIARLQGMM